MSDTPKQAPCPTCGCRMYAESGVCVAERELAAMRERDALKRMSTVEMMCENMNVNHHVTEWENRCLKAEDEVERLRELLRECLHNLSGRVYAQEEPWLDDRIRAELGEEK